MCTHKWVYSILNSYVISTKVQRNKVNLVKILHLKNNKYKFIDWICNYISITLLLIHFLLIALKNQCSNDNYKEQKRREREVSKVATESQFFFESIDILILIRLHTVLYFCLLSRLNNHQVKRNSYLFRYFPLLASMTTHSLFQSVFLLSENSADIHTLSIYYIRWIDVSATLNCLVE